MSASEHSSQASSRASRAGRKRSDYTNGALFPMIKALSTQYPPALVAAGVAVEVLQLFSMALNPHVSGHQTTWRIFYFFQLPFWDSYYATGVEYSPAFVAMYWVVTIWVWLSIILTTVGLKFPNMVATKIFKPFFRHIINLYVGPLFIPTMQALLTTMSCTPSPPAMANQNANVVWLFPEQSCDDIVAKVHRGISIALCILFSLFALVVASGNFSSDAKHQTIRKRTHPYLDIAVLIFKLGVITAFQLFLPRSMITYYNFVYAISAFAMAFLFGFVLPYHNKNMNRLMVVAYAVCGWASTVAYIDVKTNSVSFTQQGGFYAVLLLGGTVVGAAAYYLATVRFCAHTEYLFSKVTDQGFVPVDENPFAVAATASDPEMLPFPKNLPMSDFVFSPHRIVEMDVIEEAIRNEDEINGDSAVTGNESEAAAARMQKYIARVQVVSPTIDNVWLPTDAEVSTRFLQKWGDVTDTPPTPHMLSFACRIYARFLLKYPDSPTTCISYVRFLTEFAPSLSRMNLSVRLLDSMGTEMFCDLYHQYQMYYLTMSVKEVLGVRDKTHERMFRRSRRLHKATLVQTASVWRSLIEDSGNIVQLCYLTNALSDVREDCTENYLQAMNSASDDEVLFRSFAGFVETVACNKDCAGLCVDEAEAISRRRRAKLMQRAENFGNTQQPGATDAPSQHSRSSISRHNRQDDDALVALRNIEGSVANQTTQLTKNLNSRTVLYSAIAMFILLIVIVGGHAGVCLGLFYGWNKQNDRTRWGGEVRSLSQEAAVQLFRLSAVLPTSNTSTYDAATITTETNKLLAITYAYESAVNFVTYGKGKPTDSEMVKFIKAGQVFLNSYTSSSSFLVDNYNYWTASNTLVQYLTRIATYAATNPLQADFLDNTDVLFVTMNVPPKYSETYLLATEQQHQVDVRLSSTNSIAFGVSLAVFALMAMCTVYVFVWNFRRSASTRVLALKLFQMLPKDSVKRLAEDAKGRVEKFVSGESMNNEDRAGMELENPELGTSMKSEGESGGFEDDDGRRTSYTSKLLAHLFQHGAVEDDDDPPAPEGAAGATGDNALPAGATVDHPFTPVLLGTDIDPAAIEKDNKSAASSVRGTPVDTNKSSPTFTVGDGKAAKNAAAGGPPKVEGARRRHSISLGNAVKAMGESKRHRPSILNMIDSDSEVEEDEAHGGGVPSAQDVVEAELHGLSAATTAATDEDEIYEKNSFASLSGLTASMVTLIIAITVAVVVAIAFTAQILSDETKSGRRIDTVAAEAACGDSLRSTSLNAYFLAQRFVASQDYEDYQTFVVGYKDFVVSRRRCTNALPSLKSIDTNAYMQSITDLQSAMEIAVALVVADWDPGQSALFQGVLWSAPAKTKVRIDLYKPYVPNINAVWFPYTNNTYDLTLSIAARATLAEQTLYSDVSRAVFLVYLSSQSLLASAISQTYLKEAKDAADLVKVDAIVGLVMWVIVALLSLTFFAYWGGSPLARKVALAMALIAMVSTGIGGLTYQRSVDRLETKEAYVQNRLTTSVLSDSVGQQLFSAYRAVCIPTDAALYESITASQPIVLSTYQAATILITPQSPSPIIDETKTFISDRGDATRMLMVAAKLVLSATGSTLFNTEPRMTAVTWNRTAEPKNVYLTLKFPQDDANMYSDSTTDLALSASAKFDLARRVISTKRLSYFTELLLADLAEVLAEQTAYRLKQSTEKDDDFTSSKIGFLIVGIATCATYAIFLTVIAAASIKSFSRTREESDLYDAIYSGYSAIIGVGLSVVALMIIAAGIMAIVFTNMLVVDLETLNAAQKRSFYAANAMSYAEGMLGAPTTNSIVLNRLALRATIDTQTVVNTDAYFASSSGFSLRKNQNIALFGSDSAFTVRDTRTTILTVASSSTCYNPANSVNGNQQSVAILYTKFFNLMREIAYLDAIYYAGSTTLAVSVLTPFLEEARGQYDTLIHVLKVSDAAYHDEIKSTINKYFNAILAVLIVAAAIVVLVMGSTVFPIIDRVMRHEAGTKLLLTLLPDDILTTCPEITDFYDANAGTKDDQIKKKLAQSEKLLQNILPPVISRRLKNGESVIADTHPNVTVVFAALIGFDEYSAKMEAKQIVHFLNSLIVTFDQITDLLDLEKIKTIGDIYFLCGGLTKKTESDHPLRCMECALLFLDAMQENNTRHNTPNLTQRIGVNTDPAVAGVIGSKKVAYDLWGDSVNTASRMQSTGLPGKIQVSDKTYHLIKEYFAFTERKVAAKGKGELTTHLFANRTKPTPYRNLNWRVSTR